MAVVARTDRCFDDLQCTLERANIHVLDTTNLAAKRSLKKRLQDRMYQRNHRAKRKQQIRMLEHNVEALQSEVARLHRYLHRQKVAVANVKPQIPQLLQHPNGSLHNYAQSLVMHYFRVYQNGSLLPIAGLQERFLRSILAPDVVGVDLRGVDAFVRQRHLYNQYFALSILEPQAWKTQSVGDFSVMVEVEVMLYLRFHRQTISVLFSSLKRVQAGLEFVQLLITGTTSVASMYTFVVDRTGHVSKLMVCWQLLETLRRVLGSLQDVIQLTEHGCINLSSGTITVA